jgi:hypothetical protein
MDPLARARGPDVGHLLQVTEKSGSSGASSLAGRLLPRRRHAQVSASRSRFRVDSWLRSEGEVRSAWWLFVLLAGSGPTQYVLKNPDTNVLAGKPSIIRQRRISFSRLMSTRMPTATVSATGSWQSVRACHDRMIPHGLMPDRPDGGQLRSAAGSLRGRKCLEK